MYQTAQPSPPAPMLVAGPTGIAHSMPSALIVHDDSAQREQLSQTLARLGVVEIHGVDGARDAVRLLGRLEVPPALIVSTLLMPDMDGVELIAQLNHTRHGGALILLCQGADAHLIDIARILVESGQMQLLGTYLRMPHEADLVEVLSMHSSVHQALMQRQERLSALHA